MDLIPGLPDDVARRCLIRVPYSRFGVLASVCKGWKAEIESTEFRGVRKAAGLGEVLVVLEQSRSVLDLMIDSVVGATYCEISDLSIFEPHTGRWSVVPSIPGYSFGFPQHHELATVGLDIVVLGGKQYPMSDEVDNSVWIYNIQSSRWRRGADMPGPPRQDFACASDGERTVYVAGGRGRPKSFKSAMAYDVKTDEWDVVMPDMARERMSCLGIFQSGRFQVIGGYGSDLLDDSGEKSSEAFNPITRLWEPVQENILQVGGKPGPCVRGNGSTETMYMCPTTNIIGRNASGWRVIAKLPPELSGPVHLARWHEKLMVVGSELDRDHWPYRSRSARILDLNSYEWTRKIEPKFPHSEVLGGGCLEI